MRNVIYPIDEELLPPLQHMLGAYPAPSLGDGIDERRRIEEDMIRDLQAEKAENANVSRQDIKISSGEGRLLNVRLYRPSGLTPGQGAVFFIHGGGMCLGSIEAEDGTAAKLAEELGVMVLSTDYRKAPEHPHPAPLDDCYASLVWMSEHSAQLEYDTSRVIVFGGSAGGNLALALALKCRDLGGPALSYVMAPYPMVDHRNELPSTYEVTDVGIWDRQTNIEAWDFFLGGKQPDGYASPLNAADLTGLPPIFIDVGLVDLFRDENLALVQRLLSAGVPTEFHLYPGVYHAAELIAPSAARSAQIWENRLGALRRAFA